MKILLAHSFYRLPGGEDRYVAQQRELLAGRHDVELLQARNEDLRGGPRTAVSMAYSRHREREAEQVIRRFRPDIVHLHNAYPAFGPAVHLAAEKLQTPLVMTAHNHRLRCPNGLMFTEGEMCRRCESGSYLSAVLHECFADRRQSSAYAGALWLHRFVMHLQDKVALFIGPSSFMRERLVRWGIPRERTRAIPNPVEPRPVTSDPGTFGVFVGRLSTEKGADVLVQALVRAGDPPFKIVGDGPARPGVEALARQLGLRRTEFLGRLQAPDVHDVLEDCRYLVMPSVWEETGGISALEAMAHGRAILVSSLGGLTELVRDGEGLTALPGDPDDLARKITRLVKEDDLCLDAGRKAWDLCRREYSPDVHLSRLEDAYAWVLSAGGGRSDALSEEI